MLKTFLGIVMCLMISTMAFGNIDAKLSFSTDNGKTWDEDFPLLKKAQEIMVKVNWSVEENRDVKSNILITKLYSRRHDFASANRGRQHWIPGGCWFQYLKKYWAGVNNSRPFIYRLNLGVRKAGTMGTANKWSKGKKRNIDAPLPACAALSAGTYRFCIALSYRLKGSNELVEKIKEFDVTIEGDKQSTAPTQEPKKKS